MPLIEQLRAKYRDRDVEFFTLYVREPHPQERDYKPYRQPATYEEKMAHARELVKIKGLTHHVLVDGIDETVHEALGDLPNMVYVLNKQGHVYYKATWADVDRVDKALAELVTADDPSRPVRPTFDTQAVGTAI